MHMNRGAEDERLVAGLEAPARLVVGQRQSIVRTCGFFSSYASTEIVCSWHDTVTASELPICAMACDCGDVVEEVRLRMSRLKFWRY
jgi:hypothetical protein